MKPDWGWIAGIYEGEGSVIGVAKHWHFTLRVYQKDPWLLLRLKEQLGGRLVDGGVRCGRWELNGEKAIRIAEAIRPWLSPRRCAQIDKALAAWAQRLRRPATVAKCGHPFTLENTRITHLANGRTYRRCRLCDNRRSLGYSRNKRAALRLVEAS